jgi:hypothetical protein
MWLMMLWVAIISRYGWMSDVNYNPSDGQHLVQKFGTTCLGCGVRDEDVLQDEREVPVS